MRRINVHKYNNGNWTIDVDNENISLNKLIYFISNMDFNNGSDYKSYIIISKDQFDKFTRDFMEGNIFDCNYDG